MRMKKLLFFGILSLSLGFVSCTDDTDDTIREVNYSDGAFVLNEGNYPDNGTLTYINSTTGEVIDSLYYKMNGELLGNVCQDLFIEGGKIYIVSQNGEKNGSGDFLTIANARTLKKIKGVSPAELKGKNPTHIAVVAGNVYIRTSNGIYLYTSDGSISLIAGTKNAMANRMVTFGNKVYAMTSDNKVLVIEGTVVAKTIDVPGKPSGLVKAYDGNLWLSYTSPNTICKLNTSTDVISDSHSLEQPIGTGLGQVPAFGAKGNYIYFSNAKTIIYKHDFETNTTARLIDVKDVIADAKMNYNSLAVDPASGEVYFASITGYATYKTNNTTIFSLNNNTLTKKWNFENINAFPAGVFFSSNF